jgi:hypothetical protein
MYQEKITNPAMFAPRLARKCNRKRWRESGRSATKTTRLSVRYIRNRFQSFCYDIFMSKNRFDLKRKRNRAFSILNCSPGVQEMDGNLQKQKQQASRKK